jgi:hypothetical protein
MIAPSVKTIRSSTTLCLWAVVPPYVAPGPVDPFPVHHAIRRSPPRPGRTLPPAHGIQTSTPINPLRGSFPSPYGVVDLSSERSGRRLRSGGHGLGPRLWVAVVVRTAGGEDSAQLFQVLGVGREIQLPEEGERCGRFDLAVDVVIAAE